MEYPRHQASVEESNCLGTTLDENDFGLTAAEGGRYSRSTLMPVLSRSHSMGYIPHVYYPDESTLPPSIGVHPITLAASSNLQPFLDSSYSEPLLRRHSEPHSYTVPLIGRYPIEQQTSCSLESATPPSFVRPFDFSYVDPMCSIPEPIVRLHPYSYVIPSFPSLERRRSSVSTSHWTGVNSWSMDDSHARHDAMVIDHSSLLPSFTPRQMTHGDAAQLSISSPSTLVPIEPINQVLPISNPAAASKSSSLSQSRRASVDSLLPARAGGVTAFISKLYYCLEGEAEKYPEVIRWGKDGKVVLIDLGQCSSYLHTCTTS